MKRGSFLLTEALNSGPARMRQFLKGAIATRAVRGWPTSMMVILLYLAQLGPHGGPSP